MTKTPKIAKAVGRDVKEWIGKTPNSMPGPVVRMRIFDRAGGVCFLSNLKINSTDKWHLHHCDELGRGLEDGCENRERNLHPVLDGPHRLETARQRKIQAKRDHVRIKHIGADDPSPRPLKGPGFTKVVRDKVKIPKSPVPPQPGFSGCFKVLK